MIIRQKRKRGAKRDGVLCLGHTGYHNTLIPAMPQHGGVGRVGDGENVRRQLQVGVHVRLVERDDFRIVQRVKFVRIDRDENGWSSLEGKKNKTKKKKSTSHSNHFLHEKKFSNTKIQFHVKRFARFSHKKVRRLRMCRSGPRQSVPWGRPAWWLPSVRAADTDRPPCYHRWKICADRNPTRNSWPNRIPATPNGGLDPPRCHCPHRWHGTRTIPGNSPCRTRFRAVISAPWARAFAAARAGRPESGVVPCTPARRHRRPRGTIHTTFNQSINQSINRAINRSTNQPINRAINRSTN